MRTKTLKGSEYFSFDKDCFRLEPKLSQKGKILLGNKDGIDENQTFHSKRKFFMG